MRTKLEYLDKSADLLERARDWQWFAQGLREEYSRTYGDNRETHGHFNRFPISGGICEHWPRAKKDNVTRVLRRAHTMIETSLDYWKKGGRRRSTWLRFKSTILP